MSLSRGLVVSKVNPYDYSPFPDDYPIKEELIQYSKDVTTGDLASSTGIKHKWACLRFLRDIEHEGTDEFPYVFDEGEALKFLNWMKLFKHTKGVLKKQRINPHILQRFIFGNVYGWYHRDTGYRRFTKGYWQVARKNAKTQSLATVGTYEQMAFTGDASEVYVAALNREQSDILYNETILMLDGCEEMQGKYDVKYSTITHKKTGSTFQSLSRETRKSGDGKNPQCGLIDEYQAQPTTAAYDVIDSGMGARPEPLLFTITTAGFDLDYPCYTVEYKLVSDILNPDSSTVLENYFVMINELDPGDDPFDETVWIKCNPILGSYPEGMNSLRRFAEEAHLASEKMRSFLTKNMNTWIDSPEDGYIAMDKWKACEVDKIPYDLTGQEVYVGVDLSDKIDLSSVAFEIPYKTEEGDELYIIKSHSFIPKATMYKRQRLENKPYPLWEVEGYITASTAYEGELIDYRQITQYIVQQLNINKWKAIYICVDPRGATQFMLELADLGYEVLDVYQSNASVHEPTDHFRNMVQVGRVMFEKNPVLEYAIQNCRVVIDTKGQIRLDKSDPNKRIDPIAAIIDAHKLGMKHIFRVKRQELTDDFFEEIWG